MTRGTLNVALLSLLLVLGACSGDDDDDGGGAPGSSGSSGNAGKGGTTSSGNGGASGSTAGSSGQGGSTSTGGAAGGSAGSGSAGSGSAGSGSAGSGGTAAGGSGGSSASCDMECPGNRHCELVEVQCIRAPCPPLPMCVDGAAGSAGSGSAGSGSAGSGAAGSASAGSGSAGSGSGKTCGTRGAGPCPDGEFCDFPASADCGRSDASGTCATQPMICTREFKQVCGCDGQTYSNACEAHSAGVSVETDGACGGMASTTVRCTGMVTCTVLPTKCGDLQVHSVEAGCYGPCVPIDSCECAGPEDCPDSNEYTCFMSAHHCGPYV